ncbi:MAG: hypothetical protein J2P47_04585 [Acetobacteraceae bacterium]|nr:hypothetical protein [Acetobacteraceae bacterium]
MITGVPSVTSSTEVPVSVLKFSILADDPADGFDDHGARSKCITTDPVHDHGFRFFFAKKRTSLKSSRSTDRQYFRS